ncbi:MAG: hypothetical protein Q7J57_10700 [Gemmobacter sp.]|nr:hypothetical protein [Gemmobacter sp.]
MYFDLSWRQNIKAMMSTTIKGAPRSQAMMAGMLVILSDVYGA